MKAMRDVWGDTLVSLGNTNPNLLVLDADLANSTKADKFAKMYPARFLQMGIAEQNFVGAAVGLASVGFIPWLSTFAIFFTHRAADPIRMLAAQTHANIKIGAAYSGVLTGLTGKTHQDVQDLAIMRAMPGMIVLAPMDSTECEAAMRWATAHNGPVYLRLARDVCPGCVRLKLRVRLRTHHPTQRGNRRSSGLDRTSDVSVQGGRRSAREGGNFCGRSSCSLDQADQRG